MAQRPVFVPFGKTPYVDVFMVDFAWNSGFAVSQKKKNIVALHESFGKRFPEKKLLEISSKSLQEFGTKLSAFHLQKFVPSLNRSVSLECIFQGSKVFAAGGPYIELYGVSAREAKGDPRLKTSGSLKAFRFENIEYPLQPKTIFYDWLYINAILENEGYAEELMQYDGFTDIEFNPDKSINCQARSAALFVELSRKGLLEDCRSFDRFYEVLVGTSINR